MPGTRTAPSLALPQTYDEISISWIDENEKEYSNTFRIDTAAVDADLETVIANAQLGANASCWQVIRKQVYRGAKDVANAASAVHESVADKIRLSMTEIATGAYEQSYLPSPLEVLIGDGGVVDTSQAVYTNWRDAVLAVVPSGFIGLNAEFVQYSQRNDSVSP